MEITCQSCDSKIKVPDGKVPKGQPFAFKCPSCKGRILVESPLHTSPQTEEDVPAQATHSQAPPQVPIQEQSQLPKTEPAVNRLAAPVLDLRKKSAMICHTDSKGLAQFAHQLGFQTYIPEDHVSAMKSLRFNDYQLVICSADFEKLPHDRTTIFQTLQNMEMEKRRNMFVIFIGSKSSSFDPLAAFAKSSNLYLAKSDCENSIEKLIEPVRIALYENELNYSVFNKIIASTGEN